MAEIAVSVRVDIWLWRARLAPTRPQAAALVERGAVRLTHQGRQTRLEKPSRLVHIGDEMTFAVDGRVRAVRVEGMGERRGPPAEARTLYSSLDAGPEAPEHAPTA